MNRSELAGMLLQLAREPEALAELAGALTGVDAAPRRKPLIRSRPRRRSPSVPAIEATDIDVARARRLARDHGLSLK
ncbi:MAG: hypothetical protein ABJE95_27565 [Byssovorax sp.]